jgi:hypothetical protein
MRLGSYGGSHAEYAGSPQFGLEARVAPHRYFARLRGFYFALSGSVRDTQTADIKDISAVSVSEHHTTQRLY